MSAGEKIIKEIVADLESILQKSGIMYHIFSRAKSTASIAKKLDKKSELYRSEGKKLQDLLALRITLYFTDDVEIVHQYLKHKENFIDESVDEVEIDKFCPKRLNLVMRIPQHLYNDMQVAIQDTHSDLIDDTYEIQIRTILSEGWHEVEHDLRYKCKEDWNDFTEEARLLNGIYATLESSEWAMLTLFDRLAYKHYKNKNWNSMMRNKMRLRFQSEGLSPKIIQFLNDHPEVAKQIFRVSRSKVMHLIMNSEFYMPLTYDTTLHIMNRIEIKNPELVDLEDELLKEELNIIFP